MEIQFLSLDQINSIHQNQLELYGGDPGLRDIGLLQSALAMPSGGMGGQYYHSDLYEMASAYLFHLAKNHPFVDGNKRVGLVAAYIFLRLNGIQITAGEKALEILTLDTAQGKIGKAEIAAFFRKHSKKSRQRP